MGEYTHHVCWRCQRYHRPRSCTTAFEWKSGPHLRQVRIAFTPLQMTSQHRVHSALDIFGGTLVKFAELVERNRQGQ